MLALTGRRARCYLAIPADYEADEEPDRQANSSSRIWALFYRRAQKVISLTSTVARTWITQSPGKASFRSSVFCDRRKMIVAHWQLFSCRRSVEWAEAA